jgi:hypothetical protein
MHTRYNSPFCYDNHSNLSQRLVKADREEESISLCKNLPDDPIDRPPQQALNLPLIAYCYLLRRLAVCFIVSVHAVSLRFLQAMHIVLHRLSLQTAN